MKITKQNLNQWIEENRTIRYRDTFYKVRHQGLTLEGKPNGWQVKTKRYFLMPLKVGNSIGIYHKGRGVYGLEAKRNN